MFFVVVLYFFPFCFKWNLFFHPHSDLGKPHPASVLQQPQASLWFSLVDVRLLLYYCSPSSSEFYLIDAHYSAQCCFHKYMSCALWLLCFVCPLLVPFIRGFWAPAYNVQIFPFADTKLEGMILRGWQICSSSFEMIQWIGKRCGPTLC